jgi:hypothetical protein
LNSELFNKDRLLNKQIIVSNKGSKEPPIGGSPSPRALPEEAFSSKRHEGYSPINN